MIEGLILGTRIFVAAVGGEAVFAAIGTLPVIGGVAVWFANLIGPLQPGFSANLIYGVMTLQVIILPLSLILYGPSVILRGLSVVRKNPTA